VSDELESIGISLVLDDEVAEGIRRMSREIALFSRQTEFTAAQMSRVARQHLGAYLPPEPERRKPKGAPVTIAGPRAAQTMPAPEAPQAPWPLPQATARAPSAPMPNPPARSPKPPMSLRQTPVVQRVAPQVPPQPRASRPAQYP
jgi:hypothetical protein